MSIDTDYALLRQVLNEYDPQGWAVEFGVYSGYSLGLIADRMPVIGFDSFEGLPEDWREGFPKGTFGPDDGPSLGVTLLPPAHSMIVPGWFNDTLPSFPFPLLSLIHIDCDLYSSTTTALRWTKRHMMPGTIVVFDEFQGYDGWEQHEAKAWAEFLDEHEVVAEVIAEADQEKAFIIRSLAF